MAQRIVSTRAKVLGMTATRKGTCRCLPDMRAALALRLGSPKGGAQALTRSSDTIREYDAFAGKLEKHRRRARRTAVVDSGPIDSQKSQKAGANSINGLAIISYSSMQEPAKLTPSAESEGPTSGDRTYDSACLSGT